MRGRSAAKGRFPWGGRKISIFALLALAACSKRGHEPLGHDAGTSSAPSRTPKAPADILERDRFDLLPELPFCEVEHEGLLLDLGNTAAHAYLGFGAARATDNEDIEREGRTLVRAHTRALAYDFWIDETRSDTTVTLRVHGLDAKWLAVSIDDKRLGVVKLTPGETRIYGVPGAISELTPGHHRVKMTFTGGPRGSRPNQAEVDWLRIGPRVEQTGYAAPTQEDITTDVVLSGSPKRALSLSPKSRVRCWICPGPGARLRVAAGFWGAGKGTAEISVVSDTEEPVVLQSRRVSGGDGSSWTPLSVDLSAFAGKVVGLEFRALDGSRGGRVAFGDPVIVRAPLELPSVPRAKLAVLVIAAGIDRRSVPPFAPAGKLQSLGEFGRSATAFNGYRAPSVVVQSTVASLLTGMSPRRHGLENPNSRLADSFRLLSEVVKEGSGRTAMFTGVPTTFAAFGFDAGWDTFETFSPVQDLAATEPLERAVKWLGKEFEGEYAGARLLVVHTRGSHPPWDLTREEILQLKPEEYAGVLDARRAGILFAGLRARKARGPGRLQEEDWLHLRALEEAALAKQDSAFERLVVLLKKKNAWDDALVAVIGDVAPGDPPELPFDPQGPLEEGRLAVPLVVKFPGGDLSGRELLLPVSAMDLNVTILTALGTTPADPLEGVDLYAAAHGAVPVVGKPLIASAVGKYATRLGAWLLRGEFGKTPSLCAVDVDPACVNDVFDARPRAARALWLATARAEPTARAAFDPRPKERAEPVLDAGTVAALTVWGDVR